MRRLKTVGALGSAIATASFLTLGMGIVSADSISNTGPGSFNALITRSSANSVTRNTNTVNLSNENHQIAMTGSAVVQGNTYGGHGSMNYGNSYGGNKHNYCQQYGGYGQSGWSSWSPYMWQQQGHSFNDWWSGMMSHANSYGSGSWGDTDWAPSGMGWQDNWNNWNPCLWQQHGSSYASWHNLFLGHMMNYCNYWQSHWQPAYQQQHTAPRAYHNSYSNNDNYGGMGGGYGHSGSATTGNASNVNSTSAQVEITNNTPSIHSQQNTSMPYASVYDTGPRSYNVIHRTTTNTSDVTNTNNVDIQNTNNQTATSGDALVSGNTFGGNATTGSATNRNSADFMVDITN